MANVESAYREFKEFSFYKQLGAKNRLNSFFVTPVTCGLGSPWVETPERAALSSSPHQPGQYRKRKRFAPAPSARPHPEEAKDPISRPAPRIDYLKLCRFRFLPMTTEIGQGFVKEEWELVGMGSP